MRWDSRVLVWMLVFVVATGTMLMLRFDADPQQHQQALRHGWAWLRHLHGAASLALVVGTLLHVASRWWRGTRRGIQTGSYALVAVWFAVITGALAAQTTAADSIAASLGWSRAPAMAAAVVHIVYATLLVLVTLYFHIARWGWGHVFGRPAQSLLAVVVAAAVAWLLPVALPGSEGTTGSTWLLAPPKMWTWLLGVSAGLWLAAPPRDKAG